MTGQKRTLPSTFPVQTSSKTAALISFWTLPPLIPSSKPGYLSRRRVSGVAVSSEEQRQATGEERGEHVQSTRAEARAAR